MDDVLTAFKNGKQPPIHARAGRRALVLGLAAIESFQTGKRVTVPVEDYEPMNSPAIQGPPANP